MFAAKRISIKSILLLLFLGLVLGCVTPIDFHSQISSGRLVVSGQISTLGDQNSLTLSATSIKEQLPEPVSGASVILYDDNGNSFSYVEDFARPGTYVVPGVIGIPGRTYHIEIVLADSRVYRSLPQKMPEGALVDSIYYGIEEEEVVDGEGTINNFYYLKIYGKSSLPSGTNPFFLKWDVQETFLLTPTNFPDIMGNIPPPCFIDQAADPQRLELLDGTSVSARSSIEQLVASRVIDWTFLEKHYFTVYQSSISYEAYDYWHKVNILANQTGSIFDTPPAEISGNIVSVSNPSEKVLGFFQAANQNYQRFFTLKKDFPFPLVMTNCEFKGDQFDVDAVPDPTGYPARCLDCSKERNSSYSRPDWF